MTWKYHKQIVGILKNCRKENDTFPVSADYICGVLRVSPEIVQKSLDFLRRNNQLTVHHGNLYSYGEWIQIIELPEEEELINKLLAYAANGPLTTKAIERKLDLTNYSAICLLKKAIKKGLLKKGKKIEEFGQGARAYGYFLVEQSEGAA